MNRTPILKKQIADIVATAFSGIPDKEIRSELNLSQTQVERARKGQIQALTFLKILHFGRFRIERSAHIG